MSYIIGKACVDCMDTACVNVCPVDCIHGPIDIEGSGTEVEKQGRSAFPGGQLYIDPSTCIDCGACISECPPDAIYEDEKVEEVAEEVVKVDEKPEKPYGKCPRNAFGTKKPAAKGWTYVAASDLLQSVFTTDVHPSSQGARQIQIGHGITL
jgi:ferredoxin